MFKKLKERIESVDEITVPKRPPGLAIRSPPADSEGRSIANELLALEQNESKKEISMASEHESSKEDNHQETEEVEENLEANNGMKEVDDDTATKNVQELQTVLTQLSNELTSVRHQYDTLVTDCESKEEQLRSEVIHLEAQLDQRNESYAKMESTVAELNWTVENLTSRLQLYSNHDENETVIKLQKEVSELNKNHRERNLEIELLETRISALTRKRHDEQTTDTKTIRKLQEALSSLQKEFRDNDSEVKRLTDDHKHQLKQILDINREKNELEKTANGQKKTISKKEKEISELKLTHLYEMELNNEQHQKTVEELQDKLRDTQSKLKDKEDELKRIVTELPDQPITKAVLDGYSRSKMVTSFTNTIIAPGTVLVRDNQPVIKEQCDDDEPAILPVDYNVSMETEYEFSHSSQALLLNEVRTLRSENEQLSEDSINKDQTIRVQQQKISDMRKALSKGLKPQVPPPQPPSSLKRPQEITTPVTRLAIASEVNFQYLKNVVVRFICSREDEAGQLLRAITTLLELSPEEEKYIKDYLQYKMSWFGTMPSPLKISIKN